MHPAVIPLQDILQILSHPAWSGIGVIISAALSIIAIYIAQQPQSNQAKAIIPIQNDKKM